MTLAYVIAGLTRNLLSCAAIPICKNAAAGGIATPADAVLS